MPKVGDLSEDEADLLELIAQWAKAVREENLPGIRANHDPDILMFDVPPPFPSRGLEGYMATWKIFYPSQARLIAFDFEEVEITAGSDVAFATAIGHCDYKEDGRKIPAHDGVSEKEWPTAHCARTSFSARDRLAEGNGVNGPGPRAAQREAAERTPGMAKVFHGSLLLASNVAI